MALLFDMGSLMTLGSLGPPWELLAVAPVLTPAFDSIRPGGPTRTSADFSVPRLAGYSLITDSALTYPFSE